MSYTPVEVSHLSNPQISKLLKGQPVRIKSGKGHVIHLSSEQVKKHHRASMKGAGHNIVLDPYQAQAHGHLLGSGIKSKAKHAFKKAGQFVKSHKEHFRPLVRELKSIGQQGIEDFGSYAMEQGVNPELVSYYSDVASDQMSRPYAPVSGGSMKSFSKFVNKPAVKDIRRALKPLGQAIFKTAEDMAMQQVQSAPAMMSGMSGMGLKKTKKPKAKRGGALQVAGGALQVAGYRY